MLRRICLVLGAAALTASLTAAPSFAATGTTGKTHTKLTCDPSTKNKASSPAIGTTGTFQAGAAGSVVIKRVDGSTISVASVNPAGGWTDTVSTASGRRVRVLFRNSGTAELQHLGVGLSARGTFVMVTTSHCHH